MGNDNEFSGDLRSLPKGYQLLEFRFEKILGQGAFGITYLVIDTMLNRKMAIKEYFPREFAIRESTSFVKAAGGDKEDGSMIRFKNMMLVEF
jgi:serine/threonine protein kinase